MLDERRSHLEDGPARTDGAPRANDFRVLRGLIIDHGIDVARQAVSNHLEGLDEGGRAASTRRGKCTGGEFGVPIESTQQKACRTD